ncbi:hypothetical protein V8D89_001787 [Ganoderma adspersum]
MGSLPAPTPTSSEQLSISISSMSPDVSTRRVTRTETLGPGLVPVPGSPLAASVIHFPHEQRKRHREDNDETTESRKRLCPSPSSELCVYCRCPPIDEKEFEEEGSEKGKENCDPSAPTSSASSPPPVPSPINNMGTPTAPSPVYPRLTCKSARTKPVLAKESSKGVFRPQPFRRFPTTKNAERVTMRNNLRDIFLGKKAWPTNVRYARDAPPRPRPRGTHASNAAHRGLLNQPVTKRKYHYRLRRATAEDLGLPQVLDPSRFLGSWGADREWRKFVYPAEVADEDEVPAWRLRRRGEGMPVRIAPIMIEGRVPGTLAGFVHTSPRARDDWAKKEAALRALVRKRTEEAEKAGRPKPDSRRRGPDGKLIPIPPFPLVRSKLGVELGRGDVERGDEEDTTEVDAPKSDRTEVKED